MYVSKMLIKYHIKWLRGLRPEHPRRTIWIALGKVAMMHEFNMIDDSEYDDLYAHVMDCLHKSGEYVDLPVMDEKDGGEKAGE